MEGEELAARHIALRERVGLTQEQEAKMAGVSPTTISGIESGKIRRPHLKTLLKIARALGVGVGELRESESGKVEAPPSPEQPPLNGFEEERRSEWDAAVASAHELRQYGQAHMEALLSSWRKRRDRAALREMGFLLQEAYDAQTALMANLEAGLAAGDRAAAELLAAGAKAVPNLGWEEVREADRFYLALSDLVLGAGLSIRRERKPDGEVHEVEEAA